MKGKGFSLLQQTLLGESLIQTDPVCSGFLDPMRMKDVRALERLFHQTSGLVGSSYPIG